MAVCGAFPPAARLFARAAVLLAVLGVGAAAPGGEEASLLVDHPQADASVVGGGLIGPGKSLNLDETINNSEPSLTGVSGLLTTSPPGVTVDQGSSSYPAMTFGQSGTNTTPFQASLDSSVECGTTLGFTLHINADQGQQDVPFTIPTGTSGTAGAYDAADLPKAIPDNGNISSSVAVNGGGLAKGVTVRLREIDHTYDSDLKIELIAPDGTTVVLVDRRGGSGNNFTNTVLSDTASQAIASASAPFTGTYRPEQPLSTFDGHPVAGTWQLKVSDESASDIGVIKAWGADIAPAVCTTNPVASFTASPTPAPPGAAVTFDASGSVEPKPGASITSYEWDLDGNGSFETDTGSTPTVSHTYATHGTYQVGLRVTDDAGETGTKTVPLIVTQPPTVTLAASPNPVPAGSQLDLTATASDPDPGGSIVKYEWDLDGDGTFDSNTGTTPTTSTTLSSPGTYTLRVRVTDADRATAVAPVTVTVDPVGTTDQPPVASFSTPSLVVAGQPATLDASGSSDPDGTVTQYEWDFDNNGTYEQTTTSPTVNHAFPRPAGQVTVGLRVTDNSGSTDATTAKVNVVLAPSPGTLSASVPNAVPLNTPITFTDTGASDPNAGGSITKYEWDLDGNGSFETDTGTTASATHSYPSNGPISVGVRVTDSDGGQSTAAVALQINPGPDGAGAGAGDTGGPAGGGGGGGGGGGAGGV